MGAKILKCIDLHRRHLPTMDATLAARRAAQALAIAGATQLTSTGGAPGQGQPLGSAAEHGGGEASHPLA